MFEALLQDFTEAADPAQGAARLASLRRELSSRGLDGFIVPRADEHQNEYVPAAAERLLWLTGFSGSAGTAVVLVDKAAVFVDGRYTVQVGQQVDTSVFSPESVVDCPPEAWIERHLPAGARLGYDPWLTTQPQSERYARAAEAAGGTLVAADTNPLDAVWSGRPPQPLGPVSLYPDALAGAARNAKVEAVRAALGTAEALVVSDAHAVAWLFNIRGSDVAYTPLPLTFAIVPRAGRPSLYVDGAKLSNSVRHALEAEVDVAEPGRLAGDLSRLGANGARVRFDASTAPAKLVAMLREAGGRADVGTDPIALLKAAKTEAERRGARAAHARDAAAFARFLSWFASEAPRGALSEITAVAALESFRRETGALKDLAFPTIAGFGPHAAIPHYRVTTASNLPITDGIFLIDSGAQYEDGTTDITRTLVVGEPTPAMRDCFTRVLKGHIAVARAVFPRGTAGAQIDPLARQALWRAGLDFDHGTGHGVGAYLSVHEGPQRLAKSGNVALAEGMILSNEPGYYRPDQWGIRIENLLLVEPRAVEGGERPMLGFETLTLAPIDRALVAPNLMTRDEIDWLDGYHARVRDAVAPHVPPDVQTWLAEATRPVG